MTRCQTASGRLLASATAAALTVGGWLLYDGSRSGHPPQPGAADSFAGGMPAAGAPFHRAIRPSRDPFGSRVAARPLRPSRPVRIRIPAIGVDAPLLALGLDARHRIAVPPPGRPDLAGWYRGGPAPGAAGSAVIDGHVDTPRGPAVFYGLGALHRGDTVEVDRRDGVAAVFTVDAVEVYRKSAFPSRLVYGPARGAQLRVITCGGPFSRSRGYLADVVVFAHLMAAHRR